MDEKGRVALPADFRKALAGPQGGRLFLTKFRYSGRHCLDGYPEAAWNNLESKMLERSRFDKKVAQFVDAYIGAAVPLEPDSQGRILVPQTLRTHAGLQRDLMFIGRIDHFRVWDAAVWQTIESEAFAIFDDEESLKSFNF